MQSEQIFEKDVDQLKGLGVITITIIIIIIITPQRDANGLNNEEVMNY